MNVNIQINHYIDSLTEEKRKDILAVHNHIIQLFPQIKLWFEDGKDLNGQTVCNPNIGYGEQEILYANGKSKSFFRLSISANTSGISIYFIGEKDKTYLNKTFGDKIGKAKITGYCIKFKKLKDLELDTLTKAIKYGLS